MNRLSVEGRLAARMATACVFSKPSLAVQSQKEDADINVIMKRFGRTGILPATSRTPLTGDFMEFDFQKAMDTLVVAKRAFMDLPAKVRKRFGHDAGEYVKFVTEVDAEGNLVNLEEMRKMGIASPEVPVLEDKPVRVEVVNVEKPPSGNGGNASGAK